MARHLSAARRDASASAVAQAPAAFDPSSPKWLLLFHQIPPSPAYLRVKVGRRLARIGALALKNTVYVLPHTTGALEDFNWVLREVVESGGDATLVEARFVEGLNDAEVERRFRDERDEDYRELAREARSIAAETKRGVASKGAGRSKLEADIARLERRLEEIAALDFFHAPGGEPARSLISALRERLREAPAEAKPAPVASSEHSVAELQGKTWVTRVGIHVDRIASAWLVRRFVDPRAPFKFVSPKGYRPEPDEVRFDMFEAEFTHEGDLCSFEVLVKRLGLREPGLEEIAEIIHDIDLKEERFRRAETTGVEAMIAGLCMTHRSDEARLTHGFPLFDQLLAHFGRRRGTK